LRRESIALQCFSMFHRLLIRYGILFKIQQHLPQKFHAILKNFNHSGLHNSNIYANETAVIVAHNNHIEASLQLPLLDNIAFIIYSLYYIQRWFNKWKIKANKISTGYYP